VRNDIKRQNVNISDANESCERNELRWIGNANRKATTTINNLLSVMKKENISFLSEIYSLIELNMTILQ
jgi:hypothetical protein